MWRLRWSERENARSQRVHLNGLCPVCFRMCRVNSSERANFQPQPSQVHLYGFSPKFKVTFCLLKLLFYLYEFVNALWDDSISCTFWRNLDIHIYESSSSSFQALFASSWARWCLEGIRDPVLWETLAAVSSGRSLGTPVCLASPILDSQMGSPFRLLPLHHVASGSAPLLPMLQSTALRDQRRSESRQRACWKASVAETGRLA
jgi:hypothetical protein